MDSLERAELVRGWALEEGFDRAGVARLERASTGQAYLSWLERGDHADMAYLTRRVELRLDPRQMLEDGAKTALCVALQYHPLAGSTTPQGDLWPWVARYGRGLDYHDLRLKNI